MLPKCPICGGPDTVVLVTDIPTRFTPEKFRVARCRKCRVAFTDPFAGSDTDKPGAHPRKRASGTRAAIVRVFYRGEGSLLERAALFVPYLVFRFRDWVRIRNRDIYIHPFRLRGRLLDVGCGHGNYLGIWAKQHESCVGLELSEKSAAAARKMHGLDVRSRRLEEEKFPDGSFDVVTFCHALEHMENPEEVLREAVRVLRPGGEAIFWSPNFGGMLRRMFGRFWFSYGMPSHRFHYRLIDVMPLLKKVGLKPVEVCYDANELTFRRSARQIRGPWGMILRLRTTRLIFMLACKLLRSADAWRIRTVKAR